MSIQGVLLNNLATIGPTLIVTCACVGSPALTYTFANPGIAFNRGGGIKLGVGATVPAYTVPNGQFFTITDNQGICLGVAGSACFGCANGGILVVVGTNLAAANFNATSLGSVAGAAIFSSLDASLATPAFTHAAGGTVTALFSSVQANLSFTSTTTGARPATPRTGQMDFDTTLGFPVWWNGANWVNSVGVIS